MINKITYNEATSEVIKAVVQTPEQFNVEDYKQFKVYSDSEYPAELIDKQRPNELHNVKKYRKETYEPVFSEIFSRVFVALQKIRRSEGFYVNWPDDSSFNRIADDEKLKVYSEYLMDWCFNVAMKQYLIDSDGVVVVWSKPVQETTEYYKPNPYIINSDLIVYHNQDELLVFREKDDVKNYKTTYYSLDKTALIKWQRNKEGNYVVVEETTHNLGLLPAFTLGGVIKNYEDTGKRYESRIKGMLPWLNVATKEFSDLQAELTMHVHSLMWVYQTEQCTTCKGFGTVPNKKGERVPCTNRECRNGYVGLSPYEVLRVRPAQANLGETPAPTPPVGYVNKQTEIAELMDRRLNDNRYRALAAINMQFLEKTPAGESGIAKAYDREETNSLYYSIAKDIARIYGKTVELMANWRYNAIYPEHKEMLPQVMIPAQFDILSADMLIDEIKKSKDSGLNDAVLSEIEMDFIRKRFKTEPVKQQVLIDAFNLDPLSGLTEEDKALRVMNQGATKLDYIISCYIQDFIRKAYEANPEFHNLTIEEKHNVIKKMGEVKYKEISLKNRTLNQGENIGNSNAKTADDLKYTVGGLTGLIEVVKAVASGVYDLEAAVALLQDRFGLTEEEARRQLGTPQQIETANKAETISKLI
jgi:hypothetical protein